MNFSPHILSTQNSPNTLSALALASWVEEEELPYGDMATKEFETLALDGSNFPSWAMDLKFNLSTLGLYRCINETAAGTVPTQHVQLLCLKAYEESVDDQNWHRSNRPVWPVPTNGLTGLDLVAGPATPTGLPGIRVELGLL